MRPLVFLPALFLLLAVCFIPASAQTQAASPIQDNSFLLEEAYNQEDGVVQHINTFARLGNSNDWAYTFTEEWPVPAHWRHQLSVTAAAGHSSAFPGSGAGAEDALLNYRYQLVGSGETRLAFAPRVSLIVPAGKASAGRRYGGTGWQTNLPLSLQVHPKIVTHWNLGGTVIPHAQNAAHDRAQACGYNGGVSAVFLVTPRFNVLVESLYTGAQAVSGADRTQWSNSMLLSPGFRWALNFKSGLQIVPGVAVPVGLGPSAGQRGVFLYLSFEHPLFGVAKRG